MKLPESWHPVVLIRERKSLFKKYRFLLTIILTFLFSYFHYSALHLVTSCCIMSSDDEDVMVVDENEPANDTASIKRSYIGSEDDKTPAKKRKTGEPVSRMHMWVSSSTLVTCSQRKSRSNQLALQPAKTTKLESAKRRRGSLLWSSNNYCKSHILQTTRRRKGAKARRASRSQATKRWWEARERAN